jgi:hypothetical protein
MTARDANLDAVISELANALQVALPAVARIRERTDALGEDTERLELAITRAADAMRRLQPRGR